MRDQNSERELFFNVKKTKSEWVAKLVARLAAAKDLWDQIKTSLKKQ